jgi:hypothetical protein
MELKIVCEKVPSSNYGKNTSYVWYNLMLGDVTIRSSIYHLHHPESDRVARIAHLEDIKHTLEQWKDGLI